MCVEVPIGCSSTINIRLFSHFSRVQLSIMALTPLWGHWITNKNQSDQIMNTWHQHNENCLKQHPWVWRWRSPHYRQAVTSFSCAKTGESLCSFLSTNHCYSRVFVSEYRVGINPTTFVLVKDVSALEGVGFEYSWTYTHQHTFFFSCAFPHEFVFLDAVSQVFATCCCFSPSDCWDKLQ